MALLCEVGLETKKVRIVTVSGLSGAGKSCVIRCLEDLGFYCVDNLPVPLMPPMVELCNRFRHHFKQTAWGVDIREAEFLDTFFATYDTLRQEGYPIELLFVEARDEVICQRFSETRRPHPIAPLDQGVSLLDGIRRERTQLEAMKQRSDWTIDTSDYTVHQLRDIIAQHYTTSGGTGLLLSVVSFGYKYGIPPHVDMLFDVRFLDNPHADPDLKPCTGQDPRVAAYVLNSPDAAAFLEHLYGLVDFTIPLHEKEGKRYLTVGIGCTGGQHRSVVIAETLASHLKERGWPMRCNHRDIARSLSPP